MRDQQRKVKEDEQIMSRIRKLIEEEERRKDELGQWRHYIAAWKAWNGVVETIPWPVGPRGHRAELFRPASPDSADAPHDDATAQNHIRRWFREDWDQGRIERTEYEARLKAERVRWHPDRFFLRLGGQSSVEQSLIRDVTLVFQVLGGLWEELHSEDHGETRKYRRW